ncbi:MAG: GWxTD domain-containing protein [Acidobacteriales bacterium]|nr:GWxTD domain-containing protein [Terriglobales bacterium]
MLMKSFFRNPISLLICLVLAVPLAAQNQDAKDEKDPLKRELTPEQKKKLEKAFKKEVSDTYRKWLDEDVTWIITGEELTAFKQLSNDEERDQFIEQFWLRRDPTPDTVENEYKEEHYRRIAYTNERFAAGIPGWRTDRGQMYIKFGPPDTIDSHPSGGSYQRPIEEGGGETSTYPFEVWRYRYLEGENLGQEVEIEFVDKCFCGSYQMTFDRSDKDALLFVPGAGLTWYEQTGQRNKADRFNGLNYERLGASPFTSGNLNSKVFDRIAQFNALSRPPAIKFKDLAEVVRTKIRYNLLPFDVRVDLIKVTDDTALVPITIQVKNKDITMEEKEEVLRGQVNIFGQLTTLTNRIAQTFEETLSIESPSSLREQARVGTSVYWKAFPLKAGRYKLSIVVKDIKNGTLGTWEKSVVVPNMSEDRGLFASTLIVADQMEKVATRSVGAGSFVIGDTKVRPRLDSADGKPASFKQTQPVNFWMQVYNLGRDETTKKSDAIVEYQLINTTTNQAMMTLKESSADLGNTNSDQMTLSKTLPPGKLAPGLYQLTIKVSDNVTKKQLAPQIAKFQIEQ